MHYSTLVAVSLLATTAHARSPTADGLIAAAKAASGGAAWERVATWHETGHLAAGGTSGTYETWLDFRRKREAASYDLGPSKGAEGYDGHVSWTIDSSRQVHVETEGAAIADAIQQLYLFTYAFYFPDRMAGTRRLAGTRQADGKIYDVVQVTPAGADPVELWFDRATHLIAREVQTTGAHPQTFLLSHYIDVGGLKVPGQSTTRVADNPQFDQVSTTDHVALNEAIADERWSPPQRRPARTGPSR